MSLLSFLHFLGLARFALRRHLAKISGVKIGKGVAIHDGCQVSLGSDFSRRGKISIGAHTRLEKGTLLHPYNGYITLGPHVFIGPYTVVYGHGGVHVGDDCLIGMHCRILSSEHAQPPLDRRIRWEPDLLKPTVIGRDVWLGAGVTVLGGVTIGDGCVIGAGAVVTKDIPPGSIAVGMPARIIGQRPSS